MVNGVPKASGTIYFGSEGSPGVVRIDNLPNEEMILRHEGHRLRITPLQGDISENSLGMNPERYKEFVSYLNEMDTTESKDFASRIKPLSSETPQYLVEYQEADSNNPGTLYFQVENGYFHVVDEKPDGQHPTTLIVDVEGGEEIYATQGFNIQVVDDQAGDTLLQATDDSGQTIMVLPHSTPVGLHLHINPKTGEGAAHALMEVQPSSFVIAEKGAKILPYGKDTDEGPAELKRD